MKKLLFPFLIFLYVSANAQFEKIETKQLKETKIGTVQKGFSSICSLSYALTETGDTMYHLYYRDRKYQSSYVYKNVFFKGNPKMVEDMYQTFLDQLAEKKGTENAYALGDYKALVVTTSFIGNKKLDFSFTDKAGITGVMILSEDDFHYLFGHPEKVYTGQ